MSFNSPIFANMEPSLPGGHSYGTRRGGSIAPCLPLDRECYY